MKKLSEESGENIGMERVELTKDGWNTDEGWAGKTGKETTE